MLFFSTLLDQTLSFRRASGAVVTRDEFLIDLADPANRRDRIAPVGEPVCQVYENTAVVSVLLDVVGVNGEGPVTASTGTSASSTGILRRTLGISWCGSTTASETAPGRGGRGEPPRPPPHLCPRSYVDASNHRNHGTPRGATPGAGPFAGSYFFDGGPARIDVSPARSLDELVAIRTTIRFLHDPVTPGTRRANLIEAYGSFALFVQPDGSLMGTILDATGSWHGVTSPAGLVTANEWHLADFRHDGVDHCELRLDDRLVAEAGGVPGPVRPVGILTGSRSGTGRIHPTSTRSRGTSPRSGCGSMTQRSRSAASSIRAAPTARPWATS